jgi:hypothetical protein
MINSPSLAEGHFDALNTTPVVGVNRQSGASVRNHRNSKPILWFQLIFQPGAVTRLDHPWS